MLCQSVVSANLRLWTRQCNVLTFSSYIGYDKGAKDSRSLNLRQWDMVQPLLHILWWRRCCTLKHKDFVYIGEPIPELNETDHAAFLLNVQKAVLLSLKEKKLLTTSQYERCVSRLEQEHSAKQKNHRRVWPLGVVSIYQFIMKEGWMTVFQSDVIAQGGIRQSISPFYYSLGMRTCRVHLAWCIRMAFIL